MTREEVAIQIGVDTTQMPPGINKAEGYMRQWQEKQKNISEGYTGWWAKELKKREDMEVEAAVRAASRSNQARRLLRERAAVQEARRERDLAAATEAVNAGHIPESWKSTARGAVVGGAAVGAGKYLANHMLLSQGGHILRSIADSIAAGVSPWRAISMESGRIGQLLIFYREKLTKALSSLAIPLAGLVAGVSIAYEGWKTEKSQNAETQSFSEERGTLKRIAKRLSKQTTSIEQQQGITPEQANQIRSILANPSYAGVRKIQSILGDKQKLLDGLAELEAGFKKLEAARQKFQDEQDGQAGALRAAKREEIEAANELLRIGQKDGVNSLAYGFQQLEVEKKHAEVLKIQHQIEKEKTDLIEKQAQEKKKQADEEKKRLEDERNKNLPTLEELAKHGRGEIGRAARAAQRLDNNIRRDFYAGDIAKADKDIASRNALMAKIDGIVNGHVAIHVKHKFTQ